MITVLPSRDEEYVPLPPVHRATATGGVARERSTSQSVTSTPGLDSTYAKSFGMAATAVVLTLIDGRRVPPGVLVAPDVGDDDAVGEVAAIVEGFDDGDASGVATHPALRMTTRHAVARRITRPYPKCRLLLKVT